MAGKTEGAFQDDGAGPTLAGRFAIDFNRPSDGGGGLPAYRTEERTKRQACLAIRTQPALPVRARAILTLMSNPVERVLCPLAHGPASGPDGQGAYFVITPPPPGPSLATQALATQGRAWPEADLLEKVLRPVAQALEALGARRLTHRAIRPDNLFNSGLGDPAVLGCAWAAPGAAFQPALFEPPYVAVCAPSLRGEGRIADDVYALGVTLLVLTLGRSPLPGLSEAEIIQRKLEMGSFAALVAHERLPPMIADLLRGMLAEDPEHRPSPTLLLDPAVARGRRVAARPPRRAARSLDVDGVPAWDARSLAQALGQRPDRAAQMLRLGVVDHWLRRIVGDTTLAMRLEEVSRIDAEPGEAGADAVLVMRSAAVLDPLAPLWWHGVALWPDGMAAGLAEAMVTAGEGGGEASALEELIDRQAVPLWGEARPEHCDLAVLRMDARQQRAMLRMGQAPTGMMRLSYALNPLLHCRSDLLGGQCVTRMNELLPVLDRVAGRLAPGGALIDLHVASFIAARSEAGLAAELLPRGQADPVRLALGRLRSFAALQGRYWPERLPGIAGWIVRGANLAASAWRSRSQQEEMKGRIAALAEQGMLLPILDLLEDDAERAAGQRAAEAARVRLAAIDAEMRRVGAGDAARGAASRKSGREIAVALGVAAVAVSGLMVL